MYMYNLCNVKSNILTTNFIDSMVPIVYKYTNRIQTTVHFIYGKTKFCGVSFKNYWAVLPHDKWCKAGLCLFSVRLQYIPKVCNSCIYTCASKYYKLIHVWTVVSSLKFQMGLYIYICTYCVLCVHIYMKNI